MDTDPVKQRQSRSNQLLIVFLDNLLFNFTFDLCWRVMLIDVCKLLYNCNLRDPNQEVHAALQGFDSCQLRDS